MNSELIIPHVLSILKDNGWYENRKCDISIALSLLSKEGYHIFKYAEEILESLGNISVNISGSNGYKGAQFDFDPLNAYGELDRLEDFELCAGENLFPIGSMCQAFVYVGESQSIYWGDQSSFYWDGKNIEDYLNRLFDKRYSPKELDFENT